MLGLINSSTWPSLGQVVTALERQRSKDNNAYLHFAAAQAVDGEDQEGVCVRDELPMRLTYSATYVNATLPGVDAVG